MIDMDDTDSCPHCQGAGQVIVAGVPHLCYPCEGTGLRFFDTEDSGPPLGPAPCTPSN